MIKNSELLKLFNDLDFENLEKALKANITEERLKTSGSVNELSIIKRLMKANEKAYNSTLQKANRFKHFNKTLYGFTDGHYILASENTYNYDVNPEENRLKIEKIINIEHDAEFVIDIQDLKAFQKEHKSKKDTKPYIIKNNDHYIAFNPSYLLDCLNYTGSNKIVFAKPSSGLLKSPALIENEEAGKLALICPIHCIKPDQDFEYINNWRNTVI